MVVSVYAARISRAISNVMNPLSSRRRDGEKLVEHVLRVVLGFDLRESIEVLAKDIFRPLVVLLHHFVSKTSRSSKIN